MTGNNDSHAEFAVPFEPALANHQYSSSRRQTSVIAAPSYRLPFPEGSASAQLMFSSTAGSALVQDHLADQNWRAWPPMMSTLPCRLQPVIWLETAFARIEATSADFSGSVIAARCPVAWAVPELLNSLRLTSCWLWQRRPDGREPAGRVAASSSHAHPHRPPRAVRHPESPILLVTGTTVYHRAASTLTSQIAAKLNRQLPGVAGTFSAAPGGPDSARSAPGALRPQRRPAGSAVRHPEASSPPCTSGCIPVSSPDQHSSLVLQLSSSQFMLDVKVDAGPYRGLPKT